MSIEVRLYKCDYERRRRQNSDRSNEEGEPEEHGELLDVLERGIRQLVADKHAGWPLIPLKRLD